MVELVTTRVLSQDDNYRFFLAVTNGLNECRVYSIDEKGNSTTNEQFVEQRFKEENLRNRDPHQADATGKILAQSFSPHGHYFALCDDYKDLTVWQTMPEWRKISTRQIARRCTCISFTHKEDYILVSDKSGDVYRFSVSDPEQPGECILGHLSMLLDMVITSDDHYVITADRDEKIRISHFPNSYNIQSYCLGHTQFVNKLCLVHGTHIFLSASGDGNICFWNYEKGTLLHKLSAQHEKEATAVVTSLSCEHNGKIIAYCLEGERAVHLLCMESQGPGMEITRLTSIITEAPPWCLHFDPVEDYLWVVQPSIKDGILFVYTYNTYDREFKMIPITDVVSKEDNGLSLLVSRINTECSSFIEISKIEKADHSSLYVKNYDNIKGYFEQKQKRLEGSSSSKLKRLGISASPPTTQPDEKKQRATTTVV